ncbi:MAG: glycosyltransferase [Planctomycetales bacterium]|nr:glycosyltransferase [Planctomycetales bacterium]
MDQFVCVVLPVHNGQSILRHQVIGLMEVMSESAKDFEIRIVDDASTDATFEVADDLAVEYPQISVQRLGTRHGMTRAAEAAVRKSEANIVFVCDIYEPISHASLIELWKMRDDQELVLARSRPSKSIHLQDRLDSSHGVRMLRRPEVTRTPSARNDSGRIDRVTRADLANSGIAVTDPQYIQFVNDMID